MNFGPVFTALMLKIRYKFNQSTAAHPNQIYKANET